MHTSPPVFMHSKEKETWALQHVLPTQKSAAEQPEMQIPVQRLGQSTLHITSPMGGISAHTAST